jgi:hypothetical protein
VGYDGSVGGVSDNKRLMLSWKVDECKPLGPTADGVQALLGVARLGVAAQVEFDSKV